MLKSPLGHTVGPAQRLGLVLRVESAGFPGLDSRGRTKYFQTERSGEFISQTQKICFINVVGIIIYIYLLLL